MNTTGSTYFKWFTNQIIQKFKASFVQNSDDVFVGVVWLVWKLSSEGLGVGTYGCSVPRLNELHNLFPVFAELANTLDKLLFLDFVPRSSLEGLFCL